MIVEAKLELRDSASWDTLDRAIKRVGGVAAAAVEGNGKGVPTATATSEALSPRDSDDDDSTGGAFILPSFCLDLHICCCLSCPCADSRTIDRFSGFLMHNLEDIPSGARQGHHKMRTVPRCCGTIRSRDLIANGSACACAADEPAQHRRQGRLQRLRDMAAKGIRNLAEITADHISRCHPLCTTCSALLCVQASSVKASVQPHHVLLLVT